MTQNKYGLKLLEPSFRAWKSSKPYSKQIVVLMSGGVDSSVTAHLLKNQDWDVLGITMNSCLISAGGCCGADAAIVCEKLDIPHYFIDVTEAFSHFVIEPFKNSYAKGYTPNPCVDCNTFLKFSSVWDLVEKNFGISYLATGHYARITNANGKAYLGMANDRAKDQSYFLYGIHREKLHRLTFPLGQLRKEQVRTLASELGLLVADKPESMELCFAGQGDYRIALDNKKADRQGDITDMKGNKIATHKGISHYTLGQRQGLGYAGGKPLYIAKIDAETNTIALGTREDISKNTIKAEHVNILMPQKYVAGKKLFGKIRSYGNPNPCKLIEADQNSMTVEFEEAQFAPCPGQKLVLYCQDDILVAGGTIIS